LLQAVLQLGEEQDEERKKEEEEEKNELKAGSELTESKRKGIPIFLYLLLNYDVICKVIFKEKRTLIVFEEDMMRILRTKGGEVAGRCRKLRSEKLYRYSWFSFKYH
jgi:hypothetical protein